MLDALRGFSGGWVAKILIGLLVASFAVWGVSGSILYGNVNTVVQVGDTTVEGYAYRFAYENQLNALSQQAQRRLSRQEADAFGLRSNVLAQVISGAVLDENSRNMGLGISDKNLAQEIAKDPNFSDLSGNFSRGTLQATLRQYGLTEAEYIEDRKRVALRNQIQEGTASSLDMPKAFKDALSVYQNEKRVIDYVAVGPEVLDQTPAPQETDLKEYFEANKTDFTAPEYRKLTVLLLQAADVAKPQEVTNEEIKATYESRKDGLRTPEKRRIEQLVLKNMEEAEQAKSKIAAGTSFEDVVAEQGKTIADIDLGLLIKNELPDTKVADAAFAAQLNVPTDIVEGLFGPVIVRVSEIEAEATASFQDMKDQLRQELAMQKAADEVFSLFDAVEDERAAGSTLSESAKLLNLSTRTISSVDSFGRDTNGNSISGIPNLRELLQVAFQTEPGDDTRELPIGNDGFLWYEVDEITPSRQQEFDEVKDEVSSAWVASETGKKVQAIADGIAERIRGGEDFNTVLAEVLPTDSIGSVVKFASTEPILRTAQLNELGRDAMRKSFLSSKGSIEVAEANENNRIVLRIADVIAPEISTEPSELEDELNQAAAIDILNQVVADMQSRLDVSVNQAAIDAAFGVGAHR